MWFVAQVEGGAPWHGLWTFIQSAAALLGQGLLRMLNLFLPEGRALGGDLVLPLGYLGLLTVLLFVFHLIAAARKVIWLIVGIGWILLVLRVVLHALGVQ